MRHYTFTIACALFIWVICLIPIPETPLDGVPLIDKWTHFVMYGTLTLILGIETLRQHRGISLGRLSLRILPPTIAMGGLIEIAQATCTNGVRNGDWMDFVANSIGAVLGFILVLTLQYFLKK